MGPWLLAILNLTFALLCVATVFSLLARKPGVWIRILLLLAPTTILILYLGLFYIDCLVYFLSNFFTLGMRQHLIIGFLLIGYLLGMFVLWRRGKSESLHEKNMEMKPATRLWSPRKLAIAALIALVAQAITWWQLDSATTQYLHALRLEAGMKAMALSPGKPLDAQNAALLYDRAIAHLPHPLKQSRRHSDWLNALRSEPHNLKLPDPDLDDYLQQQAPLFDLVRSATELPACYFEQDYHKADFGLLDLHSMFELADLLQLQAFTAAQHGDLKNAISNVQMLYEMSNHVGADSSWRSFCYSNGLAEKASSTLQQLLSAHQPTVEDLSPLSFDPNYSQTQLLTRAIRMQEALILNEYGHFACNMPDSPACSPEKRHPRTLPPQMAKLYQVFVLENDIVAFRLYIQECLRILSLPYQKAMLQAAAFSKSVTARRRGLMTREILLHLPDSLQFSARAAARHHTTETAVAVHRFRAEEGRLPQTLQELVPKYLPAVPLDPFDEQPLRWKVTDDDWVVYSIGENLQDDGGITAEPDPREGDICFFSRLPEAEPVTKDDDSD